MDRRSAFLEGATVAKADPAARSSGPARRATRHSSSSVARRSPASRAEVGTVARARSGPGDFFGEIAAITGSPRTANVVTEEFTEVIEIPAVDAPGAARRAEMEQLINLKLSERLTRT